MTEIQPGTLIDNFRVTRLIGRGAMGQVYLGRDQRLGRRVALKMIHPRHLRSEGPSPDFSRRRGPPASSPTPTS